ncbi:hypothetical protein GCM10023325_05280 [Sphingomonas lutea]
MPPKIAMMIAAKTKSPGPQFISGVNCMAMKGAIRSATAVPHPIVRHRIFRVEPLMLFAISASPCMSGVASLLADRLVSGMSKS